MTGRCCERRCDDERRSRLPTSTAIDGDRRKWWNDAGVVRHGMLRHAIAWQGKLHTKRAARTERPSFFVGSPIFRTSGLTSTTGAGKKSLTTISTRIGKTTIRGRTERESGTGGERAASLSCSHLPDFGSVGANLPAVVQSVPTLSTVQPICPSRLAISLRDLNSSESRTKCFPANGERPRRVLAV